MVMAHGEAVSTLVKQNIHSSDRNIESNDALQTSQKSRFSDGQT